MQGDKGVSALHSLEFDEGRQPRDVVILDESGRAIIQFEVDVIDLWPALVHVWPETIGTMCAIWFLIALAIARHHATRPRRPGVLFCRRCNYELGALHEREALVRAGGVCTECGRVVTDRLVRRGRNRWVRLGLPVMLGLLPALALGVTSLTIGFPRTLPAADWFTWPSHRACKIAAARGWSRLDPFRRTSGVFEVWDLNEARRIRTLHVARHPTYMRLGFNSDRRTLIFGGDRFGAFVAIDAETGRERSRLTGPEFPNYRSRSVVAHPEDAEKVIVLQLDHETGEHRLLEWHTHTGIVTELARSDAWAYATNRWAERELLLTRIDDEPVMLTVPTFMESYQRNVFEIDMHGLEGRDASSHALTPIPNPHGSAADPTGPRLFALGGGPYVFSYSLEPPELLGRLPLPHRTTALELAMDESGRFLFVAGLDNRIFVRDIQQDVWLHSLTEDTPAYGPTMAVSAKGTWVATVSQREIAPNTRRFVHDLLVWRVPIPQAGQTP